MNKHCVNFHDASQGLVLVLTKNNDHQTLSEILQMREATSHRLENNEESENPLVEASLADNLKRLRVLHKTEYSLRLADEDLPRKSFSTSRRLNCSLLWSLTFLTTKGSTSAASCKCKSNYLCFYIDK